ncbi:MAG: class I SAM-dependent methyltransferase [Patescibacteria group bacterium]
MRKFLRAVQKVKPTGKLLDVGCAMGFFVELAGASGFDAYGFDPSVYAVAEAKKLLDGRITLGTIKEVQYPRQFFDVITLFDVFEHLVDPLGDLQKLSALLKNDGIMVIATGDSRSLMAKVMNSRWTFYNPPQHLFYFDKKTLSNLLQRGNLIPITWFRINKWLSLRYVLHLARTVGESRLGAWLYRHLAKSPVGKFPLYLPVRDNMVVIARKRV